MAKYQVFLSSASSDLGFERDELIQSLFQTNKYFPVAMEFFTSHNDIMSMLYSYMKDSDIYALVIKNDVGTQISEKHLTDLQKLMLENENLKLELETLATNLGKQIKELTYTQIEYAMALALKLKTIGFAYDDGDKDAFRTRYQKMVSKETRVKFDKWNDVNKLKELFRDSLDNTITHYKDEIVGWVRKTEIPLYVKSTIAGVTDVSLSGKGFNEELARKLETAKELCLFFTTGLGFIHSNQNLLAQFVARGGNIRLLCMYPFRDSLSEVEAAEKIKYGDRKDIHGEFTSILKAFNHILFNAKTTYDNEKMENPLGNIKVGSCGTLFRSSIVICTQKDDTKFGWLTLTLPPEKSVDMISLQIEKNLDDFDNQDNLMSAVNMHFEDVWSIAKEKNEIIEINESTDVEKINENLVTKKDQLLKNRTYWNEKYAEARKNSRARRGKKILIEIAAQHPLLDGMYPDEEFKARLNAGIEIYKNKIKEGYEVEIYVPGSIHLDFDRIPDEVSLSEAGKNYLLEHDIPENIIHGEDWNNEEIPNRPWKGVYNSGDECYIAARNFNKSENKFSSLICVCSPNQAARKTIFYIENGVLALIYTIPLNKMFHNIVDELYESIPYILEVDHNLQGENSKEALRTRKERMPE